MTVRILLAPACSGKTDYVLRHVQEAAAGLGAEPWVILARDAQVTAFQARLANAGGALGVEVMDFGKLYSRICASPHVDCELLPEPVRYRLLRMVIDDLVDEGRLFFYATLRNRPGFADLLESMIGELKQGMISADDLLVALSKYEVSGPRLEELALIYRCYEKQLAENQWGDRESMGQRALKLLQDPNQRMALGASIWVDGFDQFDTVQLNLLREMAWQAQELTITLTGECSDSPRSVHTRLGRTKRRLETMLAVKAIPLDDAFDGMTPTMRFLEKSLYVTEQTSLFGTEQISMIEAPSRAVEAREVLRWCKRQIVHNSLAPDQISVMAHRIDPYQAHLVQIAREYGLSLRLSSHLRLDGNSLVVTIQNLLSLMRHGEGPSRYNLERRRVVEVWQSPYLDWSHALGKENGITLADAQRLDSVSRSHLVIQGEAQWRAALRASAMGQEVVPTERDDDEHGAFASSTPELGRKFEAFVDFLKPPESGCFAEYASWIVQKLGIAAGDGSTAIETSLSVVECLDSSEEWARVDRAALQALLNAMQGLVWTEQGLGLRENLSYDQYLAELVGVIQSTTFAYPLRPGEKGIWVGDVSEMRGLTFEAVAIMGFSEGEFPPAVSDDPLLRDADRRFLQDRGLSIDPKFLGDERDHFYEAITRSRCHLLLSRSFLADDGADWPASIHWQELLRLLPMHPRRVSGQTHLNAEDIASRPELLRWLGARGEMLVSTLSEQGPDEWPWIKAGLETLAVRQQDQPASALDGNLSQWAKEFAETLGPDHTWSPSRLEAYRACPFHFFIQSVLGLEPRIQPEEGFDLAQRGSILHDIMEKLFTRAGDEPVVEELLALLPAIAEEVLSQAPQGLGFRETPWWQATCDELVALIQRNIIAICDPGFAEDWHPWQFEARFGIPSSGGQLNPLLVIDDGQGGVRVRGVIDRIDRNDQGQVRVIDYKSASRGGDYVKSALENGKKLQLSLYALAARDALGLGDPVEGVYWHLGSADSSLVSLAKVGVDRAFDLVRMHVLEAVIGARSGYFAPSPPDGGCPPWCPAALFCWRCQERYR